MKIFTILTIATVAMGTLSASAAYAANDPANSVSQAPYPSTLVTQYDAYGQPFIPQKPLDERPVAMPAWESGFANPAVLKTTIRNETFFPDGEG